MHEPQLERIRVLELSVQRWRLVSLALLLVVVSFMAIGCTFGLIYIINLGDRNDIERMHMEVERAHEQALRAEMMRLEAEERAHEQAQRARQEAEEARLQMLQKNQ